MLKCEYCNKEFMESMDGLAAKTFHELIHQDNQTVLLENVEVNEESLKRFKEEK